MKKVILALLAVSMVLFASAAFAEKAFVYGDTTPNSSNGEIDTNPHNEYSGWLCMRNGIGETLCRIEDDMSLGPWIAEKWNVDPENNKLWHITIDDRVKFSNGKKCDGPAVKACLDNLVKVMPRAAAMLDIEKIEAEGQEVRIYTNNPKPALMNFLSDPYGIIIDMEAGVKNGVVVATGPFKVDRFVPDEVTEMSRNEHYWRGPVHMDKMTVRSIPDEDTLKMALQSGEIDAAYGLPDDHQEDFKGDPDYKFSTSLTPRSFMVHMNFKSKITSDPAMRKALHMASNKEAFGKAIMRGNGVPGAGCYAPGSAYGGDKVKVVPFDLEGAKKVLDEAGWVPGPDGIRVKDGVRATIRIVGNANRKQLPILAEFIQADYKKIGVECNINLNPDYWNTVKNPDSWEFLLLTYVNGLVGDPEYFLSLACLDSSGANHGWYHNDKMEELAKVLAVEFDPKKRAELAVQMQQIMMDDNAFIFFVFVRMNYIMKANITGLVSHPCDIYEINGDIDRQ